MAAAEQRGILDRIKSWHIVLAFVLALVALPKGIVELSGLLMPKRPEPAVKYGRNLELWYDQGQHFVKFQVPFQVSNLGKKDCELLNVKGTFVPSLPVSNPVHFMSGNGDFSESLKPLPTPLNVSPNSTRGLEASLVFPLNEEFAEDIKHAGPRELFVKIQAKDVEIPELRFCFELTPGISHEIFSLSRCARNERSPQ